LNLHLNPLNSPKLAQFSGHRDCVYALCQGPEPHQFFSSGSDGLVVLWDVHHPDQGQVLARLPSAVYALAWHPEKKWLVAASNRDGFHILDLSGKKEVQRVAFPGIVWYRIHIQGSLLTATGSGGTWMQWDLDEAHPRQHQLGNLEWRALAFDSDQNRWAIGGKEGQIWMVGSGEGLPYRLPEIHQQTVFGLGFLPGYTRLISCGKDARLVLWEENGTALWEPVHQVPAHLFGIHDLKIHPEKPLLATGSMDKTIKIWDAETLKLLRVLDKTRHAGHGHSINQLLWLEKPELLLSCSDDRTISAWDIYS
jgi:WD40 repeat protein